ncbi:unnamed protein product [Rotaria magnacalcarata]|uniref:CCDC92/74 N-terminal domain-containing protein n=1 Tax=Rotaria magnacalcarata TaxID=392030 RepID=A0A816DQW9_9BILA|nr:unnamed protein product [Rotaria magnacalcarata]CAF1637923.1 unnamed protein product [Rotaria magnacalcarata]CAF2077499.1 unnamed protein product [Rotaria magnacalcarata]
MIRQSLVDERVSALHHLALQSPGDSDGDMSKPTARRFPAPVASRIIIRKNSSLVHISDEATVKSSSTTPSPTPTVDPRSRVELLERNLRYVQHQHEITLNDLHNEIARLQQENRDLHFRMVDIRPSSASSRSKQRKFSIAPSIQQIDDLTQSEPVLEKRLQEVQRIHFEQQINELRTRLIEAEQKNEYLMRTIDELNQVSSFQIPQASSSIVPVLLPDPNISSETNITHSLNTNDNTISNPEKTPMNDADYQHLMQTYNEKQRQQVLEIARLRAVLREIIQAERLSSTSKTLVRDCLASTSISENSIAMSTTPIDTSFSIGYQLPQNPQQHRSIASSSTAGKGLSLRHELPVRRLNLSPPHTNVPRSMIHHRQLEQRLILPPIAQASSLLSLADPTSAANSALLNSSLSPTNAGSQQQLLKLGETPIARRERRTQELQRTRLTRNLYH